ncbi:MAG: DNA-binding protein WhiA [Acutalibacteraceae bacterium]|nr:DNA-binding protein WhiA [Acutalibacteraceae bacterium]
MSFCSELKNDLCKEKFKSCCQIAECYGFMLFGRSFSYKNISLLTENKNIADRYKSFLKNNFAIIPSLKMSGKTNIRYNLSVDDPQLCSRVMSAFGYDGGDLLSINHDVFKRDCCFASFIRGAFLACGQMSDPYKNYHTEFVIRDFTLAIEFYSLLLSRGLSPRRSMRGNSTVIYFNQGETIEELLTIMGAGKKALELIDVQVAKTIRNRENRKNNLELSNIGKQVDASVNQRQAIAFLEEKGKLETLSDELYEVALLRKENPDASLTELCKLSKESITRSGLNHRLRKIIDIANEIKAEE